MCAMNRYDGSFIFFRTEFLGFMRDVLIYGVAPFGEQKDPDFKAGLGGPSDFSC